MIFHHFKTSNSSLKWKRQRMITFTSKLCIPQQFPGVHSKMFPSSPCYIKVYPLQFPNGDLFLTSFSLFYLILSKPLSSFFHLLFAPFLPSLSPRFLFSLLPAILLLHLLLVIMFLLVEVSKGGNARSPVPPSSPKIYI